MPATPNWTPEQREAAKLAHARKLDAIAAEKERANAAEVAEAARIRAWMQERYGADVQFIACRRGGKPPIFNR